MAALEEEAEEESSGNKKQHKSPLFGACFISKHQEERGQLWVCFGIQMDMVETPSWTSLINSLPCQNVSASTKHLNA